MDANGRCDQFIGLSDRAQALLDIPTRTRTHRGWKIYADGLRVVPFEEEEIISAVIKEKIGDLPGQFETIVAPLHRYTMPDGTVYVESLQAEIDSYGPMYFIALKRPDGSWVEDTLWTKDEMDEYQ